MASIFDKLNHLFACKYVPFDTFSSNQIDKMMEINEWKLKESQRILEMVKK